MNHDCSHLTLELADHVRCSLHLQLTCSGFKNSLQSLQKVEPSSTARVTRSSFPCNLCRNSVTKQVTYRLSRVTSRFSSLSRNFFRPAMIAQSRAGSYFLQRLHFFLNHCKLQLEVATCNMSFASCNGFLFPT